MKIKHAMFALTGRDRKRNEIGIVNVIFSNGYILTFDDIRNDEFEIWCESSWNLQEIPYYMKLSVDQYLRAAEEREADDAESDEGFEDDEDEDDGPVIRADDYLGQVTGVPSPGYEKELKIRDDDYLGQVTGFPTSGYEIDEDE